MYVVRQEQHEEYGIVIVLQRQEGGIASPFLAVQQALRQRRLLKESGKKVKLLIDGQVMTTSQADEWQRDEYKSLPKCQECGSLLNQEVYTHQFCGDSLFCSQNCSDQNYYEKMEKLRDEEESDL